MSSLHSRQTSEISQFSGFINVTAWAVHLPFQPSCRLVLSGTVYRKISETVVLWKLSDANLKLTCLSVHFLHRLVSRAHETSLAYIRRVTNIWLIDWLIDWLFSCQQLYTVEFSTKSLFSKARMLLFNVHASHLLHQDGPDKGFQSFTNNGGVWLVFP